MIQPEWGTKRTCPKCATRSTTSARKTPSPASIAVHIGSPSRSSSRSSRCRSSRPSPEQVKKDDDLAGDDEDIDTGEDEEPSPDDEVDLGGDDDLGVEAPQSEDEH